MKRWRRLFRCSALAACLAACLSAAGCGVQEGDKKGHDVALTIWHVYGGQTDSPFNAVIDEYNQTAGKEEGIYVQVASVTNTNTIHEDVLAAANGDPGAAELPDMFVSYPKTVLAMPDDGILLNYEEYFDEEARKAFLPEFLEEGRIGGRQLILPIAKSTEIMYVNQTAFDRFAAQTGARLEEMETWEGLFDLAERYTARTDEQTPEIQGDGKAFFAHDYHFDYFQVGTEALGEDFFAGNTIAFGKAWEQLWRPYARAALRGAVWLENGYATEALRTGDAIVTVASSASVLYYSDMVTYADNHSERIRITAFPCPVPSGGKKLVMQRGAGICTVHSDPERDKAACHFLGWLTEPAENVKFVTSAGYMPVTQKAFDDFLPGAVSRLTSSKYRELYQAFRKTQQEYAFYTAPQLETYLDLETDFEENVRLLLMAGRNAWREAGSRETELDKTADEILDQLKSRYA